ncbi:hypothetical protein J437_LFUL008050 [Ladona fulva]|uniref:Chromo domain-containing protein n=1 Tax=Ladona fulva TaxID=123851 RepID=A0A8K0KGD4_LADFU|nr:hypothetical protein J437_LFUL008050 [Ladona fulva]
MDQNVIQNIKLRYRKLLLTSILNDPVHNENLENALKKVEKVVEVRFKKGGKREFLIRWKGFSSSDDTWEPEENLNCPDLIEKFLQKLEKGRMAFLSCGRSVSSQILETMLILMRYTLQLFVELYSTSPFHHGTRWSSDFETKDIDIEVSGSESSISEDSDSESGDRPETIQDGEWSGLPLSGPSPPAPTRFFFEGESSMNFEEFSDVVPLKFFELFFNDDMIGFIANETNRYTSQSFRDKPSGSSAEKDKQWRDRDRFRHLCFFGACDVAEHHSKA